MSTLVTGTSGFVCANVARAVAALGQSVVAFDRTPADDLVRGFLQEFGDRVAFVSGDVRHRSVLERVCRQHRVDSVIHGAAVTPQIAKLEAANPARTVGVNLGGTIAMLEAARRAGVHRFVYISSSAVYGFQGSPTEPLTEETPPKPANLYGITKLAAEQAALRWHELHGMDTVAVRLRAPYGPMERPTRVRSMMSTVRDWILAAMHGERPIVPHLDVARDWTYVEDTAAGILAALRAPDLTRRVFNVSAGVFWTLGQVYEAIRAVIPSFEIQVSPASGSFAALQQRYGGGPLDPSRARSDLGFAPRYDITGGVASYVRWLRGSPLGM